MIVVCGEALVDLVPVSGGGRAAYGDGPANTAIALARLGTHAWLACRLSSDAFGRRLREPLCSNGVDLRLGVEAPEPTTLAVVSVDAAGSAEYQFYVHGTADWPWKPDKLPAALLGGVSAVHIGSLAAVLPPGADVLREWAGRACADVTVVYDVNVRPAVLADGSAYSATVARWLDVTHIVKAGHDDLAWLQPDADPIEVARHWTQRHEVGLVLVTLGADGAVAVPRDRAAVVVPGRRVPVIDTIGAGDTFCAAFMDWYALARSAVPAGRVRPRQQALGSASIIGCPGVVARGCA